MRALLAGPGGRQRLERGGFAGLSVLTLTARLHSVSIDFPGRLSTPARLRCPHPLRSQGFESLRNRISTSIMAAPRAAIGRLAHLRPAQRFGLLWRAISTTREIARTPAPNSITLTRRMHRPSSALTSRYPQGIPSRRITQRLSASSVPFLTGLARQRVRADSCSRMHGAHPFGAQRFD